MKSSLIFRSRWLALVWAAGIIWFAYSVAAPSADESNGSANTEQPTDVTGAPVTSDDVNKLADVFNG